MNFTAYSEAIIQIHGAKCPSNTRERRQSVFNVETGEELPGGNYIPISELNAEVVRKYGKAIRKIVSSDSNMPVDLDYFKGDRQKWIEFAIAWNADDRPTIERLLDWVVENHDGPIFP